MRYKLTKNCIIGIQNLSNKSQPNIYSNLLSKVITPNMLLFYLLFIILFFIFLREKFTAVLLKKKKNTANR